jgi:hypothetical protein
MARGVNGNVLFFICEASAPHVSPHPNFWCFATLKTTISSFQWHTKSKNFRVCENEVSNQNKAKIEAMCEKKTKIKQCLKAFQVGDGAGKARKLSLISFAVGNLNSDLQKLYCIL